jgi:hypothetical protein
MHYKWVNCKDLVGGERVVAARHLRSTDEKGTKWSDEGKPCIVGTEKYVLDRMQRRGVEFKIEVGWEENEFGVVSP